MLNSCAAGVAVVNIDNGFGAGVLAHRINTLGRRTDSDFGQRRREERSDDRGNRQPLLAKRTK